jgi:hypothetical protein
LRTEETDATLLEDDLTLIARSWRQLLEAVNSALKGDFTEADSALHTLIESEGRSLYSPILRGTMQVRLADLLEKQGKLQASQRNLVAVRNELKDVPTTSLARCWLRRTVSGP